MTGTDFRPGLEEERFVWVGPSQRRRSRLGVQIAATCAVCLVAGYYVGRATIYPGGSVTAEVASSGTAGAGKAAPVQATEAAAGQVDKSRQTTSGETWQPPQALADKHGQPTLGGTPGAASKTDQASVAGKPDQAASAAPKGTSGTTGQPTQTVVAPVEQSGTAKGGGGESAATAAGKAAPAPARIINAESNKGRTEPISEPQEPTSKRSTTPQSKKSASVDRKSQREKSVERGDAHVAAPRSGQGRDDAYASTPRSGSSHVDAYSPPRSGSSGVDAYNPPRAAYSRDDAYSLPRASYPRDDAYSSPRTGYPRDDADDPRAPGYSRGDAYGPRASYRPGPPWRSPRDVVTDEDDYDSRDADPRDVPRDARGYLRDFRDGGERRY